MEQIEKMSQDMDAVATQGTATSPKVGTSPTEDSHGKTQVNEPNEQEKVVEEASTLSSWGVSTVQVPQPEECTQLGLPPPVSHKSIQEGQGMNQEEFDLQLGDMDSFERNDE
jgi:hypothetical protein